MLCCKTCVCVCGGCAGPSAPLVTLVPVILVLEDCWMAGQFVAETRMWPWLTFLLHCFLCGCCLCGAEARFFWAPRTHAPMTACRHSNMPNVSDRCSSTAAITVAARCTHLLAEPPFFITIFLAAQRWGLAKTEVGSKTTANDDLQKRPRSFTVCAWPQLKI